MSNTLTTFHRLTILCEAAGISLSHACREARVNRATLERWKKSEPKTLQMLRALEQAIQEAAEAKANSAQNIEREDWV